MVQEVILVPNIPGNQARVKIKAANNIFFDISNQNFEIVQPSAPGFAFYLPQNNTTFCVPDSTELQLVLSSFLGFSSSINLSANNVPNGITVDFENTTVNPDDTTKVIIRGLGPTPDGVYNINIVGTATTGEMSTIPLTVETQNPLQAAPVTATPASGITGVFLQPDFTWAPIQGDITYHLQVSTTVDFDPANMIIDQNGITGTSYSSTQPLNVLTVYYWRISASNLCGEGPFSGVSAFQTEALNCQTFTSTNVPVNIPTFGAPNTVTSFINVPAIFDIKDINVLGLDITHSWVNDLKVDLISPNGITVNLFDQICNNGDENFDLNLDDEAASGNFPCPPVGGGTFQPQGSLSALDGELSAGTWNLSITDFENFDGGTLNAWSIEICPEQQSITTPSVITNLPLTVQQWQQENITQSFLEASDTASTPAEITYRLITTPQNGFVEFDGVAISMGATFTQEDINTNRVRYQHNGTQTTSDFFTFTVENQLGGWLGTPTFNVNIELTTDLENNLKNLSLNLYPNPAKENVWLEIEGNYNQDLAISLFTIQGQKLGVKTIPGVESKKIVRWETDHLASGMYIFQIKSNKHIVQKKVFISH